MTNLSHALGFILIAIAFVMACGVGHIGAEKRTGAFTMALVCGMVGEVLSRV